MEALLSPILQNDDMFWLTFEQAAVGIAIILPTGRFVRANPELCRFLGYSEEELQELGFQNVTYPDDLAVDLHLAGQLLDGEIPTYRLEKRYVRKGGEIVWGLLSVSLARDAHGKPLHFISVVQDATERKRAEEELHKQNSYLTALHDTTLALMNRLDLSDLLENIVGHAAQLCGTAHGYIYIVEPEQNQIEVKVGQGVFSLRVGYRMQFGEGLAGKVWETGQPLVVRDYSEWAGRSPGYKYADFSAAVGVPLKSGGQVLGVIGLAHVEPGRTFADEEVQTLAQFAQLASIALENARLYSIAQQELAERKVAQESLINVQRLYQSIWDNVADFISVHDVNGNYLFASSCCEKMLGYLPGDLVGTNLYTHIHPDDAATVADAYRRYSGGSMEHTRLKYRLCRKGGKFMWMETYSQPIEGKDEQSKVIVCVSRDVHERHHVEVALLEEKKQAEERSQELQTLALQDDLTDLHNRRAIDEMLSSKLTSRRASTYPMGCLLVDVDNFKKVNDTYGHGVGDDVIKRVARILADTCRVEDFVGRFGGDEFIIVLSHTDAAGTIIVGEKVVRNVQMALWPEMPGGEGITVSVGGTCLTQVSSLDVKELLNVLDTQLYSAKEMGRNRMVMSAQQTSRRHVSSY